MDLFVKLLLLPFFFCMTVAHMVRRLMGRDPIQIQHPPQTPSFWIVRESAPDTQSYFSEQSLCEGRRSHYQGSQLQTGLRQSSLTTRLLWRISRWFAPPKVAGNQPIPSAADRKQNIPDEIYTLW